MHSSANTSGNAHQQHKQRWLSSRAYLAQWSIKTLSFPNITRQTNFQQKNKKTQVLMENPPKRLSRSTLVKSVYTAISCGTSWASPVIFRKTNDIITFASCSSRAVTKQGRRWTPREQWVKILFKKPKGKLIPRIRARCWSGEHKAIPITRLAKKKKKWERWLRAVEKQSGSIRNYRERPRHSEAVIADNDWSIWCANDIVPISVSCS